MTISKGLRAGSRQKLRKPFRKHGLPPVTRYLHNYKRGQYVTIFIDSAIHKGMPHHTYHGKMGVVYDVSPRALGVLIKKIVGNSEVMKKVRVRIEHVRPSNCRKEFTKRFGGYMAKLRHLKREGKDTNIRFTRKSPAKPRKGAFVIFQNPITVGPQKYVDNY